MPNPSSNTVCVSASIHRMFCFYCVICYWFFAGNTFCNTWWVTDLDSHLLQWRISCNIQQPTALSIYRYDSKTLTHVVVTDGSATEVEVKLKKSLDLSLAAMLAKFANSTHRQPLPGLVEPTGELCTLHRHTALVSRMFINQLSLLIKFLSWSVYWVFWILCAYYGEGGSRCMQTYLGM